MKCQRCGKYIIPTKKFRWGCFLALLSFYVIPGLIYLIRFRSKTPNICPLCNGEVNITPDEFKAVKETIGSPDKIDLPNIIDTLERNEITRRNKDPEVLLHISDEIHSYIGEEILDKLATDSSDNIVIRNSITKLDENGQVAIHDFSIEGLEFVRAKKGFMSWQGEFEEKHLDTIWYGRPIEDNIWINLQRISLIVIYAALNKDSLIKVVRTRAFKLIYDHPVYLFSLEVKRELAEQFSLAREKESFFVPAWKKDPAGLRGWIWSNHDGEPVMAEEIVSAFDHRGSKNLDVVIPHGYFLFPSVTAHKLSHIQRQSQTDKSKYTVINQKPGRTIALAVTPNDVEPLIIEAVIMIGKGHVEVTGKMTEEMRSCGKVAWSCLRSQANVLGIAPSFFESMDAHINIPGHWIPKDGPSAGLAMALSLLSSITKRSSKLVAGITGEITLNGEILPVGSVAYKVLGAFHLGFKSVILPRANKPHLNQIPPCVRNEINLILVNNLSEAVTAVLT